MMGGGSGAQYKCKAYWRIRNIPGRLKFLVLNFSNE